MIEHTFPHQKPLSELKTTLEKAFEFYKERYENYHPTLSWQSENQAGISFSAKGFHLKGVLTLHEKEIHLSLEVPLFLKIFQAKAIAKIDSEIKRWLT